MSRKKSSSSNYQSLYLWTSFLLGMISLGFVIWNRRQAPSVALVNQNVISAQVDPQENIVIPAQAGIQSSSLNLGFLDSRLHGNNKPAQFFSTYQINLSSFASSFALSTFTYQLSGNSLVGLLSGYNLFLATTVSAQSLRVETIVSEFQVNNATTGTQYAPAFASLPSGEWVIAWLGSQVQSYDIYAQRFAQGGRPLGAEFRVNTNIVASFPRIISFATGDWVVVWISGKNIYARRFMKNEIALGAEFQVNSEIAMPDSASTFALGSLTPTEWIVVWGDKKSGDFDIYAQRLSINGSAIGSMFRVNTNTTSSQYNPTFTRFDTGDWIVVWQGSQGGDFDIYAQRFAGDGSVLGEEFRVNANSTDQQQNPAVMSFNSSWVITWVSGSGNGNTNIHARQFAKNGIALDREFQVNSDNTAGQRSNLICRNLASGEGLVVWLQNLQRTNNSINARLFSADGSILDQEFVVNINASSFRLSNFVIANLAATGQWVAAWSAQHQVSNSDIYATIFSFDDSFSITTRLVSSGTNTAATSFLSSQTQSTSSMQQQVSTAKHISVITQTITSSLKSFATSSSDVVRTTLINSAIQTKLSTQQQVPPTNDKSGTNGTVIGIVAGVAGVVGLAACAGAVGLYRKKSHANKTNNTVEKETELQLQNANRAASTSQNYSQIDKIKQPVHQYDHAPKLEI